MPVSSTLDQFHPSDMSGFLCTLRKEACSTSASVSVEISFLIGFGGSGASNEFGEGVIQRFLLQLWLNFTKCFITISFAKDRFQKETPINLCISIHQWRVRSPFFLAWPFGCNLTRENASPKAGSNKSQTTPSSSHLLTKTIQNRVPTCILNSKVNWNLMFFLGNHFYICSKKITEVILSTYNSSGKILWKQNCHSQKKRLDMDSSPIVGKFLEPKKKPPETAAELTVSPRWRNDQHDGTKGHPDCWRGWCFNRKIYGISWGWDFDRKLYI